MSLPIEEFHEEEHDELSQEVSELTVETITEEELEAEFPHEELAMDLETIESENDHEGLVEHEEEVFNTEEVEHIEPEEVEIQTESEVVNQQVEESNKIVSKEGGLVPPLRLLNIAPKPDGVPVALKSVRGQPVILMPGASGPQTIKLVNPQGEEINLSNLTIRQPITVKQPNTLKPASPAKPKSIYNANKKIINRKQKVVTLNKGSQQFMLVQKAGSKTEQLQQIKVIQTASGPTITKTMTLQQAQELGLISANTKLVQSTPSAGGAKRTVLLNQKGIKLAPQGTTTTTSGLKTVSLSQIKPGPAKILPATAGAATKIGPQRIILKGPGGTINQLPTGQLIQMTGPQGLANGQIHTINVPGKGVQYIKFVASTTPEATKNTVAIAKSVKSAITSTVTTNVQDIKPITTNKIFGKTIVKPVAASAVPKPTQLMIIPANMQLQKVPIMKQATAIQPKPVINTPVVIAKTVVTESKPDASTPPPLDTTITASSPPPGGANENSPNQNAMRPRKPCNCTRSQCLKLYCDCFANGEFCYLCNCVNCFNNLENEETRNLAIKACLYRNPDAFRPKIGKAKDPDGDVLRKHTKGCNCKRSGCLKNYCECYEAKIACSSNCKCYGCRNVEDPIDNIYENSKPPRISDEELAQTVYRKILPNYVEMTPSLPVQKLKKNSSRKQPLTYITDEVIEATCQCLLTISTDADSNLQDEELTKKQIIEEFGGCLDEIIHCSIGKRGCSS
ncbi:protein lin-54 homolog isoform X2 [Anthonomus grandis grandis]|uniref:protein lin-54 homolog isoform X2 n=1 Tax=Anthonomus grandis grandis TaxID=2921223 RepID=UPI0021654FB9|nr:protein lin-54 homolog isoform X2 [Anthonomus grandis grandis]